MSRQIHCNICGDYLGEIRSASLRKNIVHFCSDCNFRIQTIFLDGAKKIERTEKRKQEVDKLFGNLKRVRGIDD